MRTHLRAPGGEEFAYPCLIQGIANGMGIGDPEIDLKHAVARRAHLFGPRSDFFWGHQECATGAQAASVRDCNGGALAPANGARRIGTRRPNRSQNAFVRSRMLMANPLESSSQAGPRGPTSRRQSTSVFVSYGDH